jgi:hypothetical protein
MFCNCNLRVFKYSQVRAFLLYNHWSLVFNKRLVDFLETAEKFVGIIWRQVFHLDCGIIATFTDHIQRIQCLLRERRPERGYVSVVHRFQHGVLSSLQNITILSAEGHLITAGLKILPDSWVDIYLQLCLVFNRYWMTTNGSWVAKTVGSSSVMDTKALLTCS